MNRLGIVLGAACLTLLFGAAAAQPAEPDDSGSAPLKPYRKIEKPAEQSAQTGGLRVVSDSLLVSIQRPTPVHPTARSQYSMPTMEPDSTKNYTIMVMKPDPSIDYKILVTPRGVQPRHMARNLPKSLPGETPSPPEQPRSEDVPKK